MLYTDMDLGVMMQRSGKKNSNIQVNMVRSRGRFVKGILERGRLGDGILDYLKGLEWFFFDNQGQ
jgi:hypothetical protein